MLSEVWTLMTHKGKRETLFLGQDAGYTDMVSLWKVTKVYMYDLCNFPVCMLHQNKFFKKGNNLHS